MVEKKISISGLSAVKIEFLSTLKNSIEVVSESSTVGWGEGGMGGVTFLKAFNFSIGWVDINFILFIIFIQRRDVGCMNQILARFRVIPPFCNSAQSEVERHSRSFSGNYVEQLMHATLHN